MRTESMPSMQSLLVVMLWCATMLVSACCIGRISSQYVCSIRPPPRTVSSSQVASAFCNAGQSKSRSAERLHEIAFTSE